jgi:hypothetical protein
MPPELIQGMWCYGNITRMIFRGVYTVKKASFTKLINRFHYNQPTLVVQPFQIKSAAA